MRVVNDGRNVKIILDFDEVGSVAVALDMSIEKLKDIGAQKEEAIVKGLAHKLHNPEVILRDTSQHSDHEKGGNYDYYQQPEKHCTY